MADPNETLRKAAIAKFYAELAKFDPIFEAHTAIKDHAAEQREFDRIHVTRTR